MKDMTICFDHPVAVKVIFICISEPQQESVIRNFRSDLNGNLTISMDGIVGGSWKMMLEWNYEGRDFCMEKDIVLPLEGVT